jgi:formiminotetrahydrofolate cyclodeaminase
MALGILDQPAGAVLRNLASERPEVAAGLAAALTAAMAASLTYKAARASLGGWSEAAGAAAQAMALRRRLEPLAEENASAYEEALDALAGVARGEPGVDLGRVLRRAAEVPAAIVSLAESTAGLSAHVTRHADAEARADAVAGAVLAAGAARAAGHLVAVNLTVTADDARIESARAAVAAAERAASRALASG